MSLDVSLFDENGNEVFEANITHNLNKMATAAGIYQHLWRPEEFGITKAHEIIEPVSQGLRKMMENPVRFKKFNAPNGWGTWDHFVPWIEKYLSACEQNPNATIEVSR